MFSTGLVSWQPFRIPKEPESHSNKAGPHLHSRPSRPTFASFQCVLLQTLTPSRHDSGKPPSLQIFSARNVGPDFGSSGRWVVCTPRQGVRRWYICTFIPLSVPSDSCTHRAGISPTAGRSFAGSASLCFRRLASDQNSTAHVRGLYASRYKLDCPPPTSALVARMRYGSRIRRLRRNGGYHLLLAYAISWSDMERLEDVSIVCREFRIAEPPLRMIFFWLGKELLVMVQGIMVLRNHRLKRFRFVLAKTPNNPAPSLRVWCGWEMLTSPGTWWPAILAPSLGVWRGRPSGAGGYIRRASSKQASIYCRVLTDVKSISCSVLNVERTSSVSLRRASGFVVRRYVTPESKVAVVSDPAIIKMLAFICNCPTGFYCQQSCVDIAELALSKLLTVEIQLILLP
jgi:hypothetical protein